MAPILNRTYHLAGCECNYCLGLGDIYASQPIEYGEIMTDLEATRLCAEAMYGDRWMLHQHSNPPYIELVEPMGKIYHPLHDNAQCMALLWWLVSKGHHVAFETDTRGISRIGICDKVVDRITDQESMRRFLVYCVAKMQAAKK